MQRSEEKKNSDVNMIVCSLFMQYVRVVLCKQYTKPQKNVSCIRNDPFDTRFQ